MRTVPLPRLNPRNSHASLRRGGRLAVLAVLAGWLAAAGPAGAVSPEVKDQANFFSADAVKRANEVIKEIRQRHKKDLLVETHLKPPEGREPGADAKARERFFTDWAVDRARTAGVDGVYVLICKEPSYLRIAVGNETRKKAFTDADRDRLGRLLLERFKKREFDEGLLEAVRSVQATLHANVGKSKTTAGADSWLPLGVAAASAGDLADQAKTVASDAANQASTLASDTTAKASTAVSGVADHAQSWFDDWGGWLCIAGVVLLVLWLVRALVRAFTNPGVGGFGGPGGFGGGGGGFMTGLLGGLFGAAAGMWLYDSFFSGGSAQAQTPDAAGGAATDQDYTAGGGDFGTDYGGGDFGGGDFGGGEF